MLSWRAARWLRAVPRSARALCAATRERMEYDVLIVGGGPAGLSAAIRLKQLEASKGREISVCLVEKGSEIGAHILSGNVFEPRALDELIPDWRTDDTCPLKTQVTSDQFLFLANDKWSLPLPTPPMLHNTGNYIASLSQISRWLAEKAEAAGVEIYAGFAAAEVLYDEAGAVAGIATRDVGLEKDGTHKDSFERGVELLAKQTLFAEGAKGSCSEAIIDKFGLGEGKAVQTYGLGIKEVWEIPAANHKPGLVQHTLGWPLSSCDYGGSFLYHAGNNQVYLGLVVGLSYKNPHLSPYKEFQRFKHHPKIAEHLAGGECVAYGARVINEGGAQAVPKLTFPGGALIGCSAGFVNVPKIKGTHTAMKTGMLAAESVFELLGAEAGNEATAYQTAYDNSWVAEELHAVRNYKPSFDWGLYFGAAYSGLSAYLLRGREPWTFGAQCKVKDAETTAKLGDAAAKMIDYPKPDGKLSFPILDSLSRATVSHADQPAHLRVREDLQKAVLGPGGASLTEYGGPEQNFCPAGVYEYAEGAHGAKSLVINAQNCVHCKCCAIKMPYEYIDWTVPEGGGGPNYQVT